MNNKRLRRVWFALLVIAGYAAHPAMSFAGTTIAVGSKVFTESAILAEIAVQLGHDAGIDTIHRNGLGGTRVLWEALLHGDIDAYPEYTGTIVQELLPGTPLDETMLQAALAKHGIGITRSLGFNDTYAIGMAESEAVRLNISTIGNLRSHPELRMGFSNEFLERKDGWPAVRDAFDLPQKSVTGLDHDLAYKAVATGRTDVVDLYSTEAEIAFYHLRVLRDETNKLFPEYKAVYLYRLDLEKRSAAFVKALHRLEGTIDDSRMIALNGKAKLDKVPESSVAADFLMQQFGIKRHTQVATAWDNLLLRTREHLWLVGISLAASILCAVPLGVVAFKFPRLGHAIIAVVAAIYTIPSLALLVFMIPLLGVGTLPAVVALFVYGLLPILRNTHAGLKGIPNGLRDSAIVLGLSAPARLLQIELPLAAPSIMAGIKTTAVINVGTATIGALIGAGGYGQPILTGIRLADNRLILMGAVPAAILALLLQGGFGLLERWVVPRGLRLMART